MFLKRLQLTNHSLIIWLSAVLSLLAGIASFVILQVGPGVSPDSAAYIIASRKLLAGAGLEALPTHWPPFYPLCISFYSLIFGEDLGLKLLHSTINALSVGAVIFLVIKLGGSRSAFYAFATVLFLAVSPHVIPIYIMAWSEPLFILLLLCAFICLIGSNNLRSTLAAGALVGLAATTRYAGVVFIVAGLVYILFDPQTKVRLTTRLAGFLTCSCTPIIATLARNSLASGNATNRTLSFDPLNAIHVKQLIDLLGSWLIPFLSGGIALAVTTIIVLLLVRARKSNSTGLAFYSQVLILSALGYIAFIVISKVLIDHYIPFDSRIFIPAYILSSLVFFVTLYRLNRPFLKAVFLLLAFANVVYAYPSVRESIINVGSGMGYASPRFNELASFRQLENMADGRVIISNAADLIEYKTGLKTDFLPRTYNPTNSRANQDLDRELSELHHRANQNEILIVYMSDFLWRQYFIPYSSFTLDNYIVTHQDNSALVIESRKHSGGG